MLSGTGELRVQYAIGVTHVGLCVVFSHLAISFTVACSASSGLSRILGGIRAIRAQRKLDVIHLVCGEQPPFHLDVVISHCP